MHHSDQRGVLLGHGDRENDPASRNGACKTLPLPESRSKIPKGDAEAGSIRRIPSPVVDRRHSTLALQELTEADTILSRYLGPTHLIRKDLSRLILNLRDTLG
jgi:hypothetical protein